MKHFVRQHQHAMTIIFAIAVLVLSTLACEIAGLENPAGLAGKSYWAAATGSPIPTVTVFMGTSTPVYANTPVPNVITTTPEWSNRHAHLPSANGYAIRLRCHAVLGHDHACLHHRDARTTLDNHAIAAHLWLHDAKPGGNALLPGRYVLP